RAVRKLTPGLTPTADDLDADALDALVAGAAATGDRAPGNEAPAAQEVAEVTDRDDQPDDRTDELPAFDRATIDRILAGAAVAGATETGPSGPPKPAAEATSEVDAAIDVEPAPEADEPGRGFRVPVPARAMIMVIAGGSLMLLLAVGLAQELDRGAAELGSAPLPAGAAASTDRQGPTELEVTGSIPPTADPADTEPRAAFSSAEVVGAGAGADAPTASILSPADGGDVTGDLQIEGTATSAEGVDQVVVSIRNLESLGYWNPDDQTFQTGWVTVRIDAQAGTEQLAWETMVPADRLAPGDYLVRVWVRSLGASAAPRNDSVTVTVTG
ncbi:MAG: Ig-like domain-containing protein, partial [Actinomycetota bacterium]